MSRSDADLKRLLAREMDIQKCILDAIKSLNTLPGGSSPLATESTLQIVSTTLQSLLAENKLDFEIMTVIDDNDDVFKLRMLLDEETNTYTVDYIDASGSPAVPGTGIRFLNPEVLLNLVLTELQTLNTVDFATAANQALAITELQNIVTNTSDVATETTLASFLSAFSTTDFATETTLASLAATDFATETTLSGAAVDLASLLTAFSTTDFATETTLAAFSTAFSTTDFATETTLANIDSSLTTLLTTDFATETTLAALNSKFNTLGQKLSAASHPVVLSTEQEAILSSIDTAVSALDTSNLATEATLSAIETLITTIDTVLDAIKVDTANLDVALSTLATEATLSAIETLLTSIDGKDFATETTLSSIDTRLTGSQRPITFTTATVNGSTTAGVQSVSLLFRGTGGTLAGQSVPEGFSIEFTPNKGEDTVGSIAYTVPTGGTSNTILIGYVQ